MNEQIICRVLTGPTASRKSELAMRIAEKKGWEILCMDSMQIYRGMDIGTAKPTAVEQQRVAHHMIDLCDPREAYSVSQYMKDAERVLADLQKRGREGLFVGGTGLYLLGLMTPMGMGNVPADEKLRNELRMLAEEPYGREKLDERLRRSDPETADKLPLNDIRRRIRAIEVSETTGIPFSRQPERKQEKKYQWKIACTEIKRERLYDRINQRVLKMVEMGLEEEVRNLLQAGVPEDAQSMSAIGYKEMIPCIRGEITLQEAAEEIQLRSRHYAKRQITFMKRVDGIRYFDPESNEADASLESILT